MTALPSGFAALVGNIGVKDATDDFVVLAAASPVPAAGLFTRSRFAGPSVVTSRRNLGDGRAQAVVVVAKNANVANGPAGDAANASVVETVAARLGCRPDDVLIASTGVIGRPYPLERMLAGIAALPPVPGRPDDRPRRAGHHDHRHQGQDRRVARSPVPRRGWWAWPRAPA